MLEHVEELVDPILSDRKWLRTRYGYGAFGAVTRIVDPLGNPTELVVDADGRIKSRTDPASGYSEYDYTPRGELFAQVDAEGRTHEFHYDDLGRLVARKSWDGDDATWTYDCRPEDLPSGTCLPIEQGKLLRTSTASGNTVDYRYYSASDPSLGALLGYPREVTRGVRVPDGSEVVSMTSTMRYTTAGFLRSVAYPLSHDLRGEHAFEVSYLYDGEQGGQLVRVNDSVASVPLWSAEKQEHGYRINLERLGNNLGVRTVYENNTGRVSRLLAGSGDANEAQADLLQYFEYQYDQTGNIITKNSSRNAALATHYTYDSLDRLRTSSSVIGDAEYLYDDLGNLTFKPDVGKYTYDLPASRTLTPDGAPTAGLYEHYRPYAARHVGGVNVQHDLAGNETFRRSAEGTREILDYNAFNLPRRVLLDDERTVTLDYDADGQRVAKHDGNEHTYYFGGGYTRKETASGAIEHTYIVELGSRTTFRETRLDAIVPEVARTYTINDHLGSASLVTDSEGKKLSSQSFGLFGESDATLGSDKPGYTGHLHDFELSLVNMKGRLYDPMTGRFTTPDPFVFRPWGAGLNRYSYVQNNPLRFWDPSGFCPYEQLINDYCEVTSTPLPPDDQLARMEQTIAQQEAGIDAQMNSASQNRTPGAAGSSGREVVGGVPVTMAGAIAITTEAAWSLKEAGKLGFRLGVTAIEAAVLSAVVAAEILLTPSKAGDGDVREQEDEKTRVEPKPATPPIETIAFAHGTDYKHARNIAERGLSPVDAAANSRGTTRPGSFMAHLIGPPSNPGFGLQQAADWAALRRHPEPTILIGIMPKKVFDELRAAGSVVIEDVPTRGSGLPPQVVFLPASFPVVNSTTTWEYFRLR